MFFLGSPLLYFPLVALCCGAVASLKRMGVRFRVIDAGSYLIRIDSCITQLKAQGPSRTCNESKEEEGVMRMRREVSGVGASSDFSGGVKGTPCCQVLLIYYSQA